MAGENFNRNKKLLVEGYASFPNALHFQIIMAHLICDESPKSLEMFIIDVLSQACSNCYYYSYKNYELGYLATHTTLVI